MIWVFFFFQQFPEHPLCAPHKIFVYKLKSDLEDTINEIKNLKQPRVVGNLKWAELIYSLVVYKRQKMVCND